MSWAFVRVRTVTVIHAPDPATVGALVVVQLSSSSASNHLRDGCAHAQQAVEAVTCAPFDPLRL